MLEFTVLGSGSSGNSVAIKSGEEILLVDAGFSGKELQRRLDLAGIDGSAITAILLTHEHDDHCQALKIFSKRNGHIPVFANPLTAERLKYLKKLPENMNLFSNGNRFSLGNFAVEAYSISHDAVDPVGFVIESNGKKIGMATDLGHAGKLVPLKLSGSDLLMIESNHDPMMLRQSKRPPRLQHRILGRRGHLSNDMAADLMTESIADHTKHVVLVHLSSDCNCPRIVETTFRKRLQELGREDINLAISLQDHVTETIIVD